MIERLQNSRILSSVQYHAHRIILQTIIFLYLSSLLACQSNDHLGIYDYELSNGDETSHGTLIVKRSENGLNLELVSYKRQTIVLENLSSNEEKLVGANDNYQFDAIVQNGNLKGTLTRRSAQFQIMATKQSDKELVIDRSQINYILPETSLPISEKSIDHAGIIREWDREAFVRGARIYNSNCINCHGTPEIEGSIPMSKKFWEKPFKAGSDPFSMYETISRGFGAMPPQLTLTPKEKYDVILYIQENFIRTGNAEAYVSATPGYLLGLPSGMSKGPDSKPYHPWSDMDYGNFFINTYELVDEETGLPRYHSPGPTPYPDEDYSENNFAYKGIAVRVDKGKGGVSNGKAWMIFDHDLMRVAGGWTGTGFIDWNGILLNDKHETYPRTIGKLHFETPLGPGWGNPATGSFEDPRFRARDGRAFGPLPRDWADYKGLYNHEKGIVISYTVGKSKVLEMLGMEDLKNNIIFTRVMNISPSNSLLKMRIAPENMTTVELTGHGASLEIEGGFYTLNVTKNTKAIIKIFISNSVETELNSLIEYSADPESLSAYTKGGRSQYPQVISSAITKGLEDGIFATDWLNPPFDNPWNCRMKLSGIDFLQDRNKAVACTTDGDVWLITGLIENTDSLMWKRIGAGLFQPLGIKVVDEQIYVTCRDQIVVLRDLNGDGETDFYESFNHDHQVTDHFHEFAMGLQTDSEGNFYYAKSGRHARESLIPQHGTLLKVSKDGSKTDIIATGFRAANGVCLNPDGSFIVTDQQGYWNPMNRVNWVEGKGKFYGNMWGYNPPKDTSRASMEPPMVWIDMEFDRSPSEMLWVDSKSWGPLNGSLLSFSYGYGKIQLVLNEKVKGQMQGGVIDLPGVKFLTGVMRGRFNPEDGHLYACGMSAWGTNQMMKGGGLYRLRYTGKPLSVPVGLEAWESGMKLSFDSVLDPGEASDISNYEVSTWEIVRSRKYGSKRYNIKKMNITEARLLNDNRSVLLHLEEIEPVDIMTIKYEIIDKQGNQMKGEVQNTIHNLREGLLN